MDLIKLLSDLKSIQGGITLPFKPSTNIHHLIKQLEIVTRHAKEIERETAEIIDNYCPNDGGKYEVTADDGSEQIKQCPNCGEEITIKKPVPHVNPVTCPIDGTELTIVTETDNNGVTYKKVCNLCKQTFECKH